MCPYSGLVGGVRLHHMKEWSVLYTKATIVSKTLISIRIHSVISTLYRSYHTIYGRCLTIYNHFQTCTSTCSGTPSSPPCQSFPPQMPPSGTQQQSYQTPWHGVFLHRSWGQSYLAVGVVNCDHTDFRRPHPLPAASPMTSRWSSYVFFSPPKRRLPAS